MDFWQGVKNLCVLYLDRQIIITELEKEISILYGYWKGNLSDESDVVIDYFLSDIKLIPFIYSELEIEGITKSKINTIINFCENT